MATASNEVLPIIEGEVLQQLEAASSGLSSQQLIWASGYLAGRAAGGGAPKALPAPATEPHSQEQQWTILYATETGNSRRIANRLAERAGEFGMRTKLVDLADYKPRDIKKERHILVVAATHGIGEAPDGTGDFFAYLHSERAPRLEHLTYSVLSLGDSSYDDFCQVGRELDARLAALGATRLAESIDCDLDFDEPAERWIGVVVDKATLAPKTGGQEAAPRLRAVPYSTAWSRDRPFAATVLANQKITGRQSTKDVRHIELSLEHSGLDYQPGDALGVMPQNPPALVEQLLELGGLDGAAPVGLGSDTLPLHDALTNRLEITAASRGFMAAWASATGSTDLTAQLEDPAPGALRQYLGTHQVTDIVARHPGVISAQQFADSLRKLTPRLYSIASSNVANPDEVHLTVRRVHYEAFGREHWGSASEFLAGSTLDATAPVYIESNDRFRLPRDGDTPIIMIGAGTGVAPYRAFMQQRAHNGDSGKNWLFFGDRSFQDDFLYQIEWLRYRRDGVLNALDVAFSRDQPEKIYVQNRIAEHQREVYDWLENGAHVYVCGDMDHMAPDVHRALRDVVATGKGCSTEAAEEVLDKLKKAGRYQRDVY